MKKQQFFGQPDSPLFGVYHRPRGTAARTDKAVLICPPIGQEYNRTHWTLRLMANQIARRGAHVLRMDYRGLGDSSMGCDEIETLETWWKDIGTAIDHLKSQTGADSVMLIGQRMGGTLAAEVAQVRPDVNSVVLWEPVVDGKQYLDGLRKMHSMMLDLWVCKMKTPNDETKEEILGSQFRRSLLNEIENLKLDLGRIIQPQLIVDVAQSENEYAHPEPSLQKIIRDERDAAWHDLDELESAFLRPEISREIVKFVDAMFKRLEFFGVVGGNNRKLAGSPS